MKRFQSVADTRAISIASLPACSCIRVKRSWKRDDIHKPVSAHSSSSLQTNARANHPFIALYLRAGMLAHRQPRRETRSIGKSSVLLAKYAWVLARVTTNVIQPPQCEPIHPRSGNLIPGEHFKCSFASAISPSQRRLPRKPLGE